MKPIFAAAMALAVTFAGAQTVSAQPHDDHRGPPGYVKHDDWRKGGHIRQEDWQRGQAVDYRSHHLRRPPRGYEWRQVDGNYVMAAAAGGLIGALIAGH